MNTVEIMKQVPWITEMHRRVPCQGFKWNAVSAHRPPGHPANACKFMARWHYHALRRKDNLAKSGFFCTHHIYSHGLFADNPEIDRWDAWAKEHQELFNATR